MDRRISGKGSTRVSRRPRGRQTFRRRYPPDSFCPTLHACTSRTRLQKKVYGKPEAARTETKGQAFGLGPRFLRHGLVDGFRFGGLASEFRIGQALSDDLTHADVETFRIGHLAIVEPESLFVDVAEQMERLHADVGAVQLPLNQAPEIFHSVSVGVFVRVLHGVIDNRMLIVFRETIVGSSSSVKIAEPASTCSRTRA